MTLFGRMCLRLVMIVFVCFMVGKFMAWIRNPFLMASTKELFTTFRRMGIVHLLSKIIKKYILYFSVSFLISFIMFYSTYKIYKNKKREGSSS